VNNSSIELSLNFAAQHTEQMARRLFLQIFNDLLELVEKDRERTPPARTLNGIHGLDDGGRLDLYFRLNLHQSTDIHTQIGNKSKRVLESGRQVLDKDTMLVERGGETQKEAIDEIFDRIQAA
jgi:hypothetical protein